MFIEYRPGQFITTDGLRLTISNPDTGGKYTRTFYFADGSSEVIEFEPGEPDPTAHAFASAVIDQGMIEAAAIAAAHETIRTLRERIEKLPRAVGGMTPLRGVLDAIAAIEKEIDNG